MANTGPASSEANPQQTEPRKLRGNRARSLRDGMEAHYEKEKDDMERQTGTLV